PPRSDQPPPPVPSRGRVATKARRPTGATRPARQRCTADSPREPTAVGAVPPPPTATRPWCVPITATPPRSPVRQPCESTGRRVTRPLPPRLLRPPPPTGRASATPVPDRPPAPTRPCRVPPTIRSVGQCSDRARNSVRASWWAVLPAAASANGSRQAPTTRRAVIQPPVQRSHGTPRLLRGC